MALAKVSGSGSRTVLFVAMEMNKFPVHHSHLSRTQEWTSQSAYWFGYRGIHEPVQEAEG